MKELEYIKSGGNNCINCLSTNIDGGEINVDSGHASG
jgi:hypothetical protein